jgi:hypothetical protein
MSEIYRVAGSDDCQSCGGEDGFHFSDCDTLPQPKRPYKITGNLSKRYTNGLLEFSWIVNGKMVGPIFTNEIKASDWMANHLGLTSKLSSKQQQ